MLRLYVAVLIAVIASGVKAAEPTSPEPARIEQLKRLLPEKPRGVGPRIDDREAWQAVAKAPGFKAVVARAERLLAEPIPDLTDDLFLDFSRTGNRTRCQSVLGRRHSRVPRLALAECIENRGRFLPGLETAIRAVCSEKTWVMPAHDRSLRNFRGEVNQIDLAVAALSWNLATIDYWLGDKLSPEVRKLLRGELRRRTFEPLEASVTTGEPRLWWLTGTNNWNAVCLAGVTGAALTMIESPERRAFFVASAEKYIEYFLSGFAADGYCTEGVGYWNYGFGHYVMLAETIHQATGGKVDMFDSAEIERIARFGRRMEIVPGIYPAFADCSVGSQPDGQLSAFLSRRYRWGMKEVEAENLLLAAGPSTRLFGLGLYGFANSATKVTAAKRAAPQQPLRDWFPDAQILIGRPGPKSRCKLAVALKGGHNNEHHNHNDVGSFLVAVGGEVPLIDPGAEVYTARTFSSKRYDSDVLNSFGHPVPMVAGELQRTGRSAAGKVLRAEFGDTAETVVMDLRSAYDVKALKTLQRTFVFTRSGTGSLTVTDEVEFATPQSFGTALITLDGWKRLAPNRLLIGKGAAAVEVEIATDGAAIEIEAQQIKEDVRTRRLPTRLGIDLVEPVTKATIRLTIVPSGR